VNLGSIKSFKTHHDSELGIILALDILKVRYKNIVDDRAEVGTRSCLRLHEIQGAFGDVDQSSRHASRQLPKAYLFHNFASWTIFVLINADILLSTIFPQVNI
jgi:hypothetical protein